MDDSNREKALPPWGTWEVLLSDPAYKVKRLTVKPGLRMSYQKHAKRREHWLIVAGEADVTLGGKHCRLKAGDAVDVPIGAAHRITNCGKDTLVFIEVQMGTYFGEDDVIRMEDDYGREGTVG